MRDLKADLAPCQRATPGPWIFDVTQIWHSGKSIDDPDDPDVLIATMDQEHGKWQEDGHFIAAARAGWPEAIRCAMAAEERVKELEAALQLALRALTDGVADVPPGHRSPQCAKLRAEAKRVIRQALEGTGK